MSLATFLKPKHKLIQYKFRELSIQTMSNIKTILIKFRGKTKINPNHKKDKAISIIMSGLI